MNCPQCGSENSNAARFCAACGALLAPAQPMAMAAGMPASPKEAQYEAFVGPAKRDYYVNRFLRYDREGTEISWHWPAFFLTFYWLLYRKMWLAALGYFVITSVLYIPYSAAVDQVLAASAAARSVAYLAWALAVFIVPPMFANALYYRHSNKKIARIAERTPEQERQLGVLAAKGGTSYAPAIVLGLIVVLGILAAIAIPAYQGYVNKAQTAQAEGVGKVAAESVEGYYYQHGKLPASLEETSFSAPLPPTVQSLTLGANGAISMKLKSGNPAIDNGELLLTPALDDNEKVVWTCSGRDIDARYLPKHCRQD